MCARSSGRGAVFGDFSPGTHLEKCDRACKMSARDGRYEDYAQMPMAFHDTASNHTSLGWLELARGRLGE